MTFWSSSRGPWTDCAAASLTRGTRSRVASELASSSCRQPKVLLLDPQVFGELRLVTSDRLRRSAPRPRGARRPQGRRLEGTSAAASRRRPRGARLLRRVTSCIVLGAEVNARGCGRLSRVAIFLGSPTRPGCSGSTAAESPDGRASASCTARPTRSRLRQEARPDRSFAPCRRAEAACCTGANGPRTHDLRRDRPVMALSELPSPGAAAPRRALAQPRRRRWRAAMSIPHDGRRPAPSRP